MDVVGLACMKSGLLNQQALEITWRIPDPSSHKRVWSWAETSLTTVYSIFRLHT